MFCSICGIHELDGRAVPYKPTCWAKCLAVGAMLAPRLAIWVGPVGTSLLARLRALGTPHHGHSRPWWFADTAELAELAELAEPAELVELSKKCQMMVPNPYIRKPPPTLRKRTNVKCLP